MHRRVAVVVLALTIVMIDGFDLQCIGFVAPEIAREWGLPMSAFGPTFSAALAGSMLGAMAAGTAVRRWGLKGALLGCLGLFGIATWSATVASSLPQLMTLRLLAGLGLGATVPVVMSIVAESVSVRHRATLIIVALCGQPIGAILGGALCAHFIPQYGWRFAFEFGGVLPLLLAPLTLLVLRASPEPRKAAIHNSDCPQRARDLFNSGLWQRTSLIWSISFFSILFVYIIVNWMPAAVRDAGYSLQKSVLAIGLFNLGGIIGSILIGAAIDAVGPARIMPLAFAVGAACLAMLDTSRATLALFLLAVFASGLAGYGGVISIASLTVMIYPKSMQTVGVGWTLGVGRLGAAVGPLCASAALGAGFQIGRLFYVAAGAALLAMMMLSILLRRAGSQLAASRG